MVKGKGRVMNVRSDYACSDWLWGLEVSRPKVMSLLLHLESALVEMRYVEWLLL